MHSALYIGKNWKPERAEKGGTHGATSMVHSLGLWESRGGCLHCGSGILSERQAHSPGAACAPRAAEEHKGDVSRRTHGLNG